MRPNLDAALELRSDAGDLVASSNPVDAIGASISAVVASGTYYVYVRGTGKGDPLATGYTDYGIPRRVEPLGHRARVPGRTRPRSRC